jgi:PAS domain S-box-containing protein
VLLDVMMPEMDGYEVCCRLKAMPEVEDIPVVFMSALDDVKDKVRGFEVGGIDYVLKPLQIAEVVARVKRHVTVSMVRTALQESEAKFRSVTESAHDAIISADSDGNIRSWNRAAEALLGFNAGEAIGQPIELIIPDRFQDAHRGGLSRVAGGGESRVIGHSVELAARNKSGVEIPIELSLGKWDLDGERYFTGILRDITERKDAAQKFRSVTEAAIDAIISADAQGVIVGWNHAAQRMFGHTAEEAIGEPLEFVIPDRFHDAHSNGMKRHREGGESRVIGQTVELAAVRRGGAEIPIELSLSTWTVESERFTR